MRKLLLLIGALLAVHVALLFVQPTGALEPPSSEGLDVGIVFDVGGRGDKSFNDGAYLGATRAAEKLGARLRLLAAEGMDLVVGVGFIFTDDLTQLAREYPSVRFAGVDLAVANDSAGNPIAPPPNLAALKFREEQGSYLVGALAALLSRETRIGDRAYRPTTRVGFVGGMDIPLIHKFEAGYRAGVARVCPECQVIAQYAGVTPEAFRNPGRGKEIALSQYQSGVNVIFHASGSTGLGVFEAARSTG
jgi:basic membrane protein A